ncbi:vomeronasal type-1 receptor 4-like [Acomys russatus]|uniref:vomeronasal type-1 receptor 4-like n=1 Tax=Acomys russatus TaxID=60746 RepID=UPI0021E215AF|nr:vomeronasal type-1 receptor 4-like [Acomys russatus]
MACLVWLMTSIPPVRSHVACRLLNQCEFRGHKLKHHKYGDGNPAFSIGALGIGLWTKQVNKIITTLANETFSILYQNEALKTTAEVALQIFLLCQLGVGTVANILLFVHNFSPILTGSQPRPIQVLFTNLAVANALILLILAFPSNVTVVVPREPPTDLKCKLGYFLHVVARSTDLCSICVLSIYQFITLVPPNWGRVMLRALAPKIVSYSCYSCWLFGVLNNAYIPMTITGPQDTGNDTGSQSKWVCSTSAFSVGMGVLRCTHDTVFISIMVWACVSMVILLNRHHQRLQHIHTPNRNHRGYAEIRAAHTILMLVVTFVSMYILDCISAFFHAFFVDSRLWFRRINVVLAASFPTISPLLLIIRDPRILWSVLFS